MAFSTSLAGYWPLADVANQSRPDLSPNGQDLTDNNGVASSITSPPAGIQRFAVFVAATPDYLSRADSTSLSMGAGVLFTLCFWVKFNALPGAANSYVVGKTGAATREYLVYTSPTGGQHLIFEVAGTNDIAMAGGSITTATWYFVYVIWDGTNIRIAINMGSESSAAGVDATDGANNFAIGTRGDGDVGEGTDGNIAQVAIWKRVLTTSELSQIYNSGNGVANLLDLDQISGGGGAGARLILSGVGVS